MRHNRSGSHAFSRNGTRLANSMCCPPALTASPSSPDIDRMPHPHIHTRSSKRNWTLPRRTGIALLLWGISLVLCTPGIIATGQQNETTQGGQSVSLNEHAVGDPQLRSSTRKPLQWRRTTVGWEPTVAWRGRGPQLGPPPAAAKVHPIIIASLQMLLSIGALLVFEYTDEDESTDLVHMLNE